MLHEYAVITGGAGCLGQAIAQELGNKYKIILIDSNARALQSIRNTFNSPEDIHVWTADITAQTDLQQVSNALQSLNGSISILVNCVGISPKKNGKKKTIEDISIEEWENVMRVNLTGMFNICKLIVPFMKRKQYGRIINISSLAGRTISATAGIHYCSSKAGVLGFTRSLAHELAPFNILVNAVAPGKIVNNDWEDDTDQLHNYINSIPLKRLAEAREIAQLISFLASEKSSYMTGTTIDINGGKLMI